MSEPAGLPAVGYASQPSRRCSPAAGRFSRRSRPGAAGLPSSAAGERDARALGSPVGQEGFPLAAQAGASAEPAGVPAVLGPLPPGCRAASRKPRLTSPGSPRRVRTGQWPPSGGGRRAKTRGAPRSEALPPCGARLPQHLGSSTRSLSQFATHPSLIPR